VWWTYWFHWNSIFVGFLYQDFNVWTVLIKLPNGLTSHLLIMLILLQSRSERSEFSWLQRFRWFWSRFSSNFYGIEIPRFHKIRCPNRYIRACIECVETPGFQIPTGQLFSIMHALLLSTNWFRSNVGGMLLIVWNSLITMSSHLPTQSHDLYWPN
jgi:hypothetical protein